LKLRENNDIKGKRKVIICFRKTLNLFYGLNLEVLMKNRRIVECIGGK